MVRALAALLAAGLTVVVGCGPRVSDAELTERWLSRTCTVDDRGELDAGIRENAAEIEPVFIDAFNQGPSAAEREEVIESVEHLWSRMQLQLAEPGAYNLDQEKIAALKSISLTEEKNVELELFDFNYRAAALRGLGVTQGAAGKALLMQTAANSDSPFSLVATEALGSNASGKP